MVSAAIFRVFFIGTLLCVAANAVDARGNLRRSVPKVGLEVKLIASKEQYTKECEKDGLMPMFEPGMKGKIKEIDEAGAGSALLTTAAGDEAWVPIRALIGMENWVKGMVAAAPAAAPAPAPAAFSLSAPAVDTSPTDFMASGCQRAREVKDTFNLALGMTSRKCFYHCSKKAGMKYFGVTGGGICFCSALPPGDTIGSKECDIKCSGTPKELCGGINQASTVYTMINCDPPSVQEKGWLATARMVKLAGLYDTFESQSCGQSRNNVCELNGSSRMVGTPEECKMACWDAKGSEGCDGFTYDKTTSKCTFFKDVLNGKVKLKSGLTCYFKKLGFPSSV